MPDKSAAVLNGCSIKEEPDMSFSETCIYQVKPQKSEEFQALMQEAKTFLEQQEGLLLLRLIKR